MHFSLIFTGLVGCALAAPTPLNIGNEDLTVEAGGGAISIGGHAKGGSVGNDPGSSVTIHVREEEAQASEKLTIGLGIPAVVVDGHPIKLSSSSKRDESIAAREPFNIISGGPAISFGGNSKGGDVGSGGSGEKGGSGGVKIGKREVPSTKDDLNIISGGIGISFGGNAQGGNVGSGGNGAKGGSGGVKIS